MRRPASNVKGILKHRQDTSLHGFGYIIWLGLLLVTAPLWIPCIVTYVRSLGVAVLLSVVQNRTAALYCKML
jgi:hypothetical protein